jgi:AraC-like DNA-binding protein
MDILISPRVIHVPAAQAEGWGLHVVSTGCSGREAGHDGMGPEGRVLGSFALVYVTRGGGTFWTGPASPRAVTVGDMLLLFPGVWHRYRPSAQVGWNEYWVLFDGPWARSILRAGIISPDRPLLRPGLDATLHRLLVRMLDAAADASPGHARELAGMCMHVLARALSLSESSRGCSEPNVEAIDRALTYLREHVDEDVDLEGLASSVGLSYPHFRRLFGRMAGVAPHQYHLELRIAHAKELLERGSLSVKQIAARVGFADQYYFARLFKKKTGVPPSRWVGM